MNDYKFGSFIGGGRGMMVITKASLKSSGACFGLIILLSFYFLSAPGIANEKERALNYEFDWAQFRGNDSLSYVELYLSIPLELLTFVNEGDNFKLGFKTILKASIGDSVYFNRSVKHPFSSATAKAENPGKRLLVVEHVYLLAGEYQFTIEIVDLYGDQSKKKTFKLLSQPIRSGEFALSDLELATLITRDSIKTQYYKNQHKVMPNVSNLFGASLPALYYYSEIYNIPIASPNDTSRFVVRRRIVDSQKRVIKALPDKLKRKPGESAVELGRINILTLPSGTYFFELEIQDLFSEKQITKRKKFFIYRPRDFVQKTAETKKSLTTDSSPEIYPDSRYETMPEKEVNEEFETTKYISRKQERKTFKKLELTGKKQFLKEFWAKRDSEPTTRRNEYRDLYLSRVKYANQHFKGFRAGWKSDRGRVLLLYGEPDEIERAPFSSENKPYQSWKYYSLQGGVEFIFVDKRNFGDFELVHSTARGELSDYSWQRWITTIN